MSGIPQPQTEEKIQEILSEAVKSTMEARHIGARSSVSSRASSAEKIAVDNSKRRASSSSSSGPSNKKPRSRLSLSKGEKTKNPPRSSVFQLHCKELTCLETFDSSKEMEEHARTVHNLDDQKYEDVDHLLVSSDEDEVAEIPVKKKENEQTLNERSTSSRNTANQPPVKPRMYSASCRKCDYKTMESDDPRALEGLVAQLRLHHDLEHNGNDLELDEHKKLTAPVQVEAGVDNRETVLHQGRYLGAPLNWEIAYLGCPLSSEPVNKRIDLIHEGVTVHNTWILEKCHNRGCRTLKLDHFSEENLKIARADQPRIQEWSTKGHFVEGKGYEEVQKIQEAVKAAQNASAIWVHVHRYDPSMTALAR